jgi:hypothetical protein
MTVEKEYKIDMDYGSDGEQYFRVKKKSYKIGNLAFEFSEMIPNVNEKGSDISKYIVEKEDDLDK